jgi:hypothetical protein
VKALTLDDIVDHRAYERERESFRAEVIALKRLRRIAIGPIVTVVFENRTTMRFQVQEMARAERLVTDDGILHELEVYNPLIPAPGELSMTLFIELTSEAQLREWLPKLVGIERDVLLRIGEGDELETVRAEVDPAHESQLTRDTTTPSVHYVRLQLTDEQRRSFVSQPVEIAVEHPSYSHHTELPVKTKVSLAEDWNDE